MQSFIEYTLISFSLLLLTGVLASKVSDRFGIPALLLFLAIGMLAGSEGPGGIYFDDARLAQYLGTVALVLILFAGGLDTDWDSVRPVIAHGTALSTAGVLITALIVSVFAVGLLHFTWLEGLLLGAIVSSTDAAAVFSILRSRSLSLKGRLQPLLELESGSNDPMAVFLTLALIQMLTQTTGSWTDFVQFLLRQFLLGAAAGLLAGRGTVLLVNWLRLGYEGLYPVLTLSLVLLTYGVTSWIGGNGFLAVYLAGILAGNRDFIHKRSLLRFHDGMAWLMQIIMFLTLGLLVFPRQLIPVAGVALAIAAGLILVARPVSIFLCLLPTSFNWREKTFLSWVGLRGAVPIVLATYPLLAGLSQASLIFNVVFFVVLTSVLFQGTTVARAARVLQVDAPARPKPVYPLEYTPVRGMKSELKELRIPVQSAAAGRSVVEMSFPAEFLIVLIGRGGEFVVPGGASVLQAGDTLLVLASKDAFRQVEQRISVVGTSAAGGVS